MKLLSFGEVLFDIYPDSEYLGGAPLNLAAHATLQGADAYLLSAVGADALGEKAIAEVEGIGVKTDYVVKLQGRETGCCIVTLDENAVPSYDLKRDVAYDYVPYTELGDEKFDVFAFGTLALRQKNNIETVKRILNENEFGEIYSDLNIRAPFYSKESILFCLENATIVKISDEELPTVTENVFDSEMETNSAADALIEKFRQIKLLIITCGENGSCVYDRETKMTFYCPAETTELVSTVGAGDSFGATFITEYFKGSNIMECLRRASKVSAFVVSRQGAVPEDIIEFINKEIK